MPAVTLTPSQQALLDQFESDASDAVTSQQKAADMKSALLQAEADATAEDQLAIASHAAALASAQAFIDSMLKPLATSTPATSSSAAK